VGKSEASLWMHAHQSAELKGILSLGQKLGQKISDSILSNAVSQDFNAFIAYSENNLNYFSLHNYRS
jgi:hypothetical protein